MEEKLTFLFTLLLVVIVFCGYPGFESASPNWSISQAGEEQERFIIEYLVSQSRSRGSRGFLERGPQQRVFWSIVFVNYLLAALNQLLHLFQEHLFNASELQKRLSYPLLIVPSCLELGWLGFLPAALKGCCTCCAVKIVE